MRKERVLNNKRDLQLYAVAGLIAGFVFVANLNLHEVLRLDRLKHVSLSFLMFFYFLYIFRKSKYSFVWASLLAFTVGVLKEVRDHQAQVFDVYANSVGITVALLCVIAFLSTFTQLKKTL